MALDIADVIRERRFLAAHPEWNIFSAGHGIPRDGGVADLLADAAAPSPKFAVLTVHTCREWQAGHSDCHSPPLARRR